MRGALATIGHRQCRRPALTVGTPITRASVVLHWIRVSAPGRVGSRLGVSEKKGRLIVYRLPHSIHSIYF